MNFLEKNEIFCNSVFLIKPLFGTVPQINTIQSPSQICAEWVFLYHFSIYFQMGERKNIVPNNSIPLGPALYTRGFTAASASASASADGCCYVERCAFDHELFA